MKFILDGACMNLIHTINQFFWGYPALFILMGTHLYFTIRLRFVQKKVFCGIRLSVTSEVNNPDVGIKKSSTISSPNGISGFSALMTTLAATLGTGNIIGMSTAVALGGPGAVLWCWLTGILGMATSYAECYLSHHYQYRRADGTLTGGAMYIFTNILKRPLFGIFFALAVLAASLFLGCATQANSAALAAESAFGISPALTGLFCAILVGAVLMGGCRAIGKVCSILVPFMGIFYIICCAILLILTKNNIQPALKLIAFSAFSKESMTGGILGGGITTALRYGIARGLFTNEAGLGTAGLTCAAARTKSSKRQALISMTGVFWDTVVMCGITGLVIITGFLENPARILTCNAGELTLNAFSLLPWGEQLLSISLILFAVSTMIGWFFLGEHAFAFLEERGLHLSSHAASTSLPPSKKTHLQLYKCAYLILLFVGSFLSMELIWELTDFINLFLLLPNLYLLWRLRRQVQQ